MTAEHRIETDAELCRECQACTLACSLFHEGQCSPSLARLQVLKDMARYKFQILICRQCDSPDCMDVCPSEAMARDERGVVSIVDEECLRCGACASACPHGAIFYNEATDRYLKCDMCAGRDGGPLCVAICPVGALVMPVQAGCTEE